MRNYFLFFFEFQDKCSLIYNFSFCQAQREPQIFVQPEIDFSPWNPIDYSDFSPEIKNNKARSILASPAISPRPFIFKARNTKPRSEHEESKEIKRRVFIESTEHKSVDKPTRTSYRRKPTSTSATTIAPSKNSDNSNIRLRHNRKNITTTALPSTTPKHRRQFTARTLPENVLMTTSQIPLSTKASAMKVPLTRGNFRPNPIDKEMNGNADSEEQNYPEHFKLLLKNKQLTDNADKIALKKSVKPFRPLTTEKSTKSPIITAPKKNVLFPTRSRAFPKFTTTTESVSTEFISVTPRKSLRRPRPTERTKTNVGSTLQEPPTAKATRSYATRSPGRQHSEESVKVKTQTNEIKQIDSPVREYFPRAVSVRNTTSKRTYRFKSFLFIPVWFINSFKIFFSIQKL